MGWKLHDFILVHFTLSVAIPPRNVHNEDIFTHVPLMKTPSELSQ